MINNSFELFATVTTSTRLYRIHTTVGIVSRYLLKDYQFLTSPTGGVYADTHTTY